MVLHLATNLLCLIGGIFPPLIFNYMAWSEFTGPDGQTYQYVTHGKEQDAQAKVAAMNNQAMIDMSVWKYKQDIAQWHRENEYNSPVEQAKRFSQAGMNPALFMGQGSSAASSPEFSSPNLSTPTLPSAYGKENLIMNSLGQLNGAVGGLNQSLQTRLANEQLRLQELKTNAEVKDLEESRKLKQAQRYTYAKDKIVASWLDEKSESYKPYLKKLLEEHEKEFYRSTGISNQNAQNQADMSAINKFILDESKDALVNINKRNAARLYYDMQVAKSTADYSEFLDNLRTDYGLDARQSSIFMAAAEMAMSDPKQGEKLINQLLDNLLNYGGSFLKKMFPFGGMPPEKRKEKINDLHEQSKHFD